jgi:hypothetical protein
MVSGPDQQNSQQQIAEDKERTEPPPALESDDDDDDSQNLQSIMSEFERIFCPTPEDPVVVEDEEAPHSPVREETQDDEELETPKEEEEEEKEEEEEEEELQKNFLLTDDSDGDEDLFLDEDNKEILHSESEQSEVDESLAISDEQNRTPGSIEEEQLLLKQSSNPILEDDENTREMPSIHVQKEETLDSESEQNEVDKSLAISDEQNPTPTAINEEQLLLEQSSNPLLEDDENTREMPSVQKEVEDSVNADNILLETSHNEVPEEHPPPPPSHNSYLHESEEKEEDEGSSTSYSLQKVKKPPFRKLSKKLNFLVRLADRRNSLPTKNHFISLKDMNLPAIPNQSDSDSSSKYNDDDDVVSFTSCESDSEWTDVEDNEEEEQEHDNTVQSDRIELESEVLPSAAAPASSGDKDIYFIQETSDSEGPADSESEMSIQPDSTTEDEDDEEEVHFTPDHSHHSLLPQLNLHSTTTLFLEPNAFANIGGTDSEGGPVCGNSLTLEEMMAVGGSSRETTTTTNNNNASIDIEEFTSGVDVIIKTEPESETESEEEDSFQAASRPHHQYQIEEGFVSEEKDEESEEPEPPSFIQVEPLENSNIVVDVHETSDDEELSRSLDTTQPTSENNTPTSAVEQEAVIEDVETIQMEEEQQVVQVKEVSEEVRQIHLDNNKEEEPVAEKDPVVENDDEEFLGFEEDPDLVLDKDGEIHTFEEIIRIYRCKICWKIYTQSEPFIRHFTEIHEIPEGFVAKMRCPR